MNRKALCKGAAVVLLAALLTSPFAATAWARPAAGGTLVGNVDGIVAWLSGVWTELANLLTGNNGVSTPSDSGARVPVLEASGTGSHTGGGATVNGGTCSDPDGRCDR